MMTNRRAQARAAEIAPSPKHGQKTWPARDRLVAFGSGTRIVSVVEALRMHPYLGRIGPEPEIRELIIGGTPYSILYGVRANRLILCTTAHASQSK